MCWGTKDHDSFIEFSLSVTSGIGVEENVDGLVCDVGESGGVSGLEGGVDLALPDAHGGGAANLELEKKVLHC